ncbi:nuclear pore complex protein Nup214 isoform X2 [Astyanax mexicanus]|uniref:nuclear pore complex protein Nup214 isoform X2 n=1 Tax=Astyanax mexicanus TaxID=7994 RepID=UPI0020CAC6A4|nr:nuclear pore complex protein Nup214 isoform X2 [Astyanax mexicanus]
MGDDQYPIPERDMKDFQFRQMKKIRVFDSPDDLQKERSGLLAISNKFGVTFVGLDRTLKVYLTREIIAAAKVDGNINEIVENVKCQVLSVDLPMHHLALSSDELTLSVCGVGEDAALTMDFYDVRTFFNKARQEKRPFASFKPEAALGTAVQDLKWSPVDGFKLAACLSDGSMMILDVINDVALVAQLPATVGITCVCWSPKGKQVAAGKLNGTVVQYTPILQEKKVIPCAPFYSTDPVKVLDVLWLSTFNFAVAYAAADGSPVTPPDLVVISLPKKDEKRPDQYLNFGDLVYGSCTEREHHYFLCHIEDWDLVLAASAASIEVSVIAKQEDKTNWELWVLEDAARGELPVTLSNDDTLPVGVAIDYTSQGEIYISDDKKLPPAPTLLILSTDGVLCPFSLINLNPGVRQLVTAAGSLALDGERPPLTKLSSATPAYVPPVSNPPSVFSSFQMPPTTAPVAPPPAATSAPPAAPASSSFGMSFSLPPPAYTAPPSTAPVSTGPSLFSFNSASSSTFSFAAPKPAPAPTSAPSASTFTFSAPVIKPPAETSSSPAPPPQRVATASPITVLKPPPEPATPNVRMNLNDRFLAVDGPAAGGFGARPFSSTPIISSQPTAQFSITKPAPTAVTRPVQTSTPPVAVQKTATPTPPSAPSTAPSAAPQPVSVKPVEKPLQLKKDADPVMVGILEEIAHFQKEMDELKARSNRADFRVGSSEEMRDLRKESEDLHGFTLEIKETTESLHGDISTLKTTLLEGFAGVEEARAQRELNRDKGYLQLLYKKPLDPRSDQQLKEIRKLYQYVKFAVEDVNDVLDLEWEKHLEKKKKQRHMIVPEREALYTALANNMDIINQQKQKLDQLVRDLQSLRLYNKTSTWNSCSQPASTSSSSSSSSTRGLDSELESLRNALVKASLETAPKAPSKSPSKMTPVKQSQLRNFLSKRQTPPVRSTAPANLSRSAFLSPKYYEDLDDVSSTSSLSQSQEPEEPLALAEEEEEEEELPAIPVLTPRHPAVVRTASIQPGFPMQPSPFSRVQMPPKISMDSADSTILATKTVKHGPPPTTAIPAAQAAGLAALTRQRNSERPAPTSLNESTLKNVPQVVNVQELKDKGPPMPVSTVISPSVPAPAAHVVQQVLAAAGAKKNPAVNVPESTATPQTFMFVPPSAAPSATPGSIFSPPVTSFTPVQSAPAEAPAASRQPNSNSSSSSSKTFSFSPTPSSTPFSFPLSSTTSQPPAASSSHGKDVGPESKFLSSSEAPFSFSPKPPASSTGGPSSRAAVSGETLGSFSCLRVGQSEEARDAPVTLPGFTFGVPGNGAAFTFGPQQKPAASGNGQSSIPLAATDVTKPPEPAAPLTTNPAFTGGPSPAPPTSFSSLLATPLPSEIPSTNEQPRVPQASGPSPPPELEARPLEPSPEPPAATTPSPVLVGEELAPIPVPATAFVVPSQPEPQAAAAQTGEQLTTHGLATQVVPALNVTPTPPTLAEPAAVAETLVPEVKPLPMSTPAPTPIATQANLEQASFPALVAPSVAPVAAAAAAPAPSAAATTAPAIPVLAPAQAPPSTTPGSIFAQPAIVTTTNGTTLSVTSFTPVISTAGVATPSSTSVTPVAPSTASQAPAPIFGQPGTVATVAPTATTTTTTSSAPVFGTSTFGAASTTSGFGKPVFGHSASGGFGQPAASAGSASGFTFGQSTFGASSGFGQTNPPANAPASSAAGGGGGGAGGGGLFGSSSTSSASSFSFGASSTSSAASTGTNLFGQNTAPAFGQQQGGGFGQPSMFGSNTTTTTSSGFGFGQQAAFGSTPTPSVFGQQPSGGSVFGQQQPSSGGSLFGSGPGNPAPTGGGFFSGLGGKPSEDAANKNPFGTNPTGGFGQTNQPGSTSLFGNSGAKAFGFGSNTFGEQKPSGTFSAGGGSVAAQGFGSFSTPAKTGGFGAAPVFGSPPAFGGSPAFGATGTFGNSPGFNNPMGASPGKVFGEGTSAASVGGFGFASPPSAPSFGNMSNQSSAPSFGSIAQQGSGFGTPQNQNVGFSAFGSSGGAKQLWMCNVCGWSKVTTYQGLRIHQGKMGCK